MPFGPTRNAGALGVGEETIPADRLARGQVQAPVALHVYCAAERCNRVGIGFDNRITVDGMQPRALAIYRVAHAVQIHAVSAHLADLRCDDRAAIGQRPLDGVTCRAADQIKGTVSCPIG